ncbi:hypothetical protein IWQ61_005096 [Dispira simplex]|nr:hypothetical protein IWQ61_005096 [Dispira simplex]
MKLARFTALSIVATCLSGSVWATGNLFNTQWTSEICTAIWLKFTPQMYDRSVDEINLSELRQLATSEIIIEEPKELSPEIAGAARVFLLEKQYLVTGAITKTAVLNALSENSQLLSHRYFTTAQNDAYTFIHNITVANDANEYSIGNEYGGFSVTFFQLSNTNPVEANAANFIEQCCKFWKMLPSGSGLSDSVS